MEIAGRVPEDVLLAFGFSSAATWQPLGSGHIHTTLLVEEKARQGVLQRINTYVFQNPAAISHNLRTVGSYLRRHYPDYLFIQPIATRDGKDTATDREQRVWRLLPFVPGTFTLEKVETAAQAFEAARGFGLFARNVAGLDPALLHPTIDRFHDLSWRYVQFEQAIADAPPALKKSGEDMISRLQQFRPLVDTYRQLIASARLPLRVTHNDTKINNVLFACDTQKAACVIDLDTVMPGYFIYDLGDLVRTCSCPAGEDETDLSKIRVRQDVVKAVTEGYLAEMNDVLTPAEKEAIPFAGQMMTYIMALRFFADYLNGNVYYKVKHPLHNLRRAVNQVRLLEALSLC